MEKKLEEKIQEVKAAAVVVEEEEDFQVDLLVQLKRPFSTNDGHFYEVKPEGVTIPFGTILPSDAKVWNGRKFVPSK
jgi:hypothetical protein